jgi:cell division septation protein DedD
MSEETLTNDEQSHYEISLTAGQAFIAFVLMLLSLAASFAFGLMIGRGQGEDRLVVKKEPTVVTEASVIPKKNAGKIVELGVAEDDFSNPATKTDITATTTAPAATETTATATPVITEAAASAAAPAPAPAPVTAAVTAPAYAQLLSTGDQKTAEALAAKLINGGFTNAYVERTANEKGPIFRVRVKFASEAEAKASEAKLKVFSNDVWITK